MKQVITNLYWEAIRELEKMHKTKMLLSDRIAFEKALVQLDAIKKILDYSSVTINN